MPQADVRLLNRELTWTQAYAKCTYTDATDNVTKMRTVSGAMNDFQWQRAVTLAALRNNVFVVELSSGLSFGLRFQVSDDAVEPVASLSFRSMTFIEQMQDFQEDENADRIPT
ncbi:MAG: hypothetical protein NTZ05_05775 [Chloroflexi bacterium]|nr:hypothetical protein [Chloroflexota bacterium]